MHLRYCLNIVYWMLFPNMTFYYAILIETMGLLPSPARTPEEASKNMVMCLSPKVFWEGCTSFHNAVRHINVSALIEIPIERCVVHNYWKLNCAIVLIKHGQFTTVFFKLWCTFTHIYTLLIVVWFMVFNAIFISAHFIISTSIKKIPFFFCSLLKNINLEQMYFSYIMFTTLSISKCIAWTNFLWSPGQKCISSSR